MEHKIITFRYLNPSVLGVEVQLVDGVKAVILAICELAGKQACVDVDDRCFESEIC